MPRPMLHQPKTETKSGTDSILSATAKREVKQVNTVQNQLVIDRLLRKPRSKEYMKMMTRLDAGGHTHNRAKVQEIIDAIREEFPEVEINGVFLGVVSECFLGLPYEVHTLDIAGGIIEHYTRGETLPGQLEKARSAAMRGGYAFIEVYADCCRCISSDGSVSVVKG